MSLEYFIRRSRCLWCVIHNHVLFIFILHRVLAFFFFWSFWIASLALTVLYLFTLSNWTTFVILCVLMSSFLLRKRLKNFYLMSRCTLTKACCWPTALDEFMYFVFFLVLKFECRCFAHICACIVLDNCIVFPIGKHYDLLCSFFYLFFK